jgi:tRNA (guanine-N7-)-methyltransferase
MPHIVARSFSFFGLPAEHGEYRFLWFARPLKGTREWLVAVERKGGERFLLRLKPKNESWIIKGDKTTRPSPLHKLKEALAGFCVLAECDRISDNISAIRSSPAAKADRYLKRIEWFVDNFPTRSDVWIEVGFGSGRHLLYQAQLHPQIQFIGIEVHRPSIEQLLGQIALKKLDNILVVDYDARLFLELAPSNVVGKIFVHFPVPWDKKPHRRVISAPFVKEALRVLRPQGELEVRTDSENYFRYTFELFMQQPQVQMRVSKNTQKAVVSKYEERWLRLEKDIYELGLVSLEQSPQKKIGFGFEFERLRYSPKINESFTPSTHLFDDYFIHFQKLYEIDQETLLMELSFGSFDRPTHSYILIKRDGASYFAKEPIPSYANIQAHKKIEELIDV